MSSRPVQFQAMGRAPNSGGPQRVSAHVVPKAKPFSVGDEEEKTTNDSQWEDEASTTVEQGDVAYKVRELVDGAARITITNESDSGEALGESTVDEQRADLGIG